MRISEWIVLIFFGWTSVLAVSLSISDELQTAALVANFLVFLTYLVLPRLRFEWVEYARDWIPQAFIALAYKEMGWFAPLSHNHEFETRWIVWDRLLLDDWHGRAIIESAGSALPFLLELSYVLVYAVPPVTMGILYRLGLRRRADTMLTIYALAMLLCYAQFPFWPSEPPRVVFPGQDMPHIVTPIRTFNLWIVGSYGIHTSVFPSAHVSGAIAAALAFAYLAPRRRLLTAAYFVYAVFVAVATVYGRYHYAVDAAAGLFVGTVAFYGGRWLTSRVGVRALARELAVTHVPNPPDLL
jgi:membrane-associated phospholipid phosphatase